MPFGRKARDDRAVLNLILEHMRCFGGDWIRSGERVLGPARLGVILGPSHCDDDNHLDIRMIVNAGTPMRANIDDCAVGLGPDVESQRHSAVDVWATLTASAVIEAVNPTGRHGETIHPSEDRGYPGWLVTTGGYIGWGVGSDGPDAMRDWAAHRPLLRDLADQLAPTLVRPQFNGVRIFVGGRAGDESAEVRVNGVVNAAASEILLGLDWPRQPKIAYAKTFFVLVRPEDSNST